MSVHVGGYVYEQKKVAFLPFNFFQECHFRWLDICHIPENYIYLFSLSLFYTFFPAREFLQIHA